MPQEKMTTRMWRLYDLIKANTTLGKEPLTQKQICDVLPEYYHYSERTGATDKCTMIWSDVNFINTHDEVEKIIVCDKFTYRIGTKEESEKYMGAFMRKALLALKRYWNIKNKIDADGQGKLISDQDKPIDENSQARAFVEAFLEEFK